jgi:hypothetical protein
MTTPKKTTALTVKLCIFMLTCFSFNQLMAQAIDMSKMTPDERKATQSKIEAASRVDWKNTMDMLGLKMPELVPVASDTTMPPNLNQKVAGSGYWFDTNGSQVTRTMWGNWTNYYESKANNYVLIDPLKLKNGKPVNNASTWWKKRRPEILADYEENIYGYIPKNAPKVTFEVTAINDTAMGGKAVKKTIVGHIDNSAYPEATPTVLITLYIPKNITGKVPLLVTVGGFLGRFPGSKSTAPTALDMVLAKGWAIATVNTGALQADNGAGFKTGIIGLLNKGNMRKPDEWGVFSAWCWGLSRAFDYFETEPSIDSKKIGIEGHSRWGKTALLESALDSRWAICYASCAGSMGSALEKRDYGENINDCAQPGEYHWMAANFLKYAGKWQSMPVDAHELIALVAPRPLLITGGTQDQWADPKGEFLACVAASPVYELLGKKGISTTEMPPPDVALTDGDLAFREHIGWHTDLPDWPVFISFAERYFNNK